MQLVQTELVCGSTTHMVVFLPKDSRVKVGKRLTLDKDDRLWTVVKQYDTIESGEIKRGWNNNY
jgi:hypothetical protein